MLLSPWGGRDLAEDMRVGRDQVAQALGIAGWKGFVLMRSEGAQDLVEMHVRNRGQGAQDVVAVHVRGRGQVERAWEGVDRGDAL